MCFIFSGRKPLRPRLVLIILLHMINPLRGHKTVKTCMGTVSRDNLNYTFYWCASIFNHKSQLKIEENQTIQNTNA